jgi:glycosyltransferase involved in cell wall biosynthesis
MTFSAIVPSYRRPDLLRRCVQAILAGRRAPDELIAVVRDTDTESQELVRGMAEADARGLLRPVLVHEAGQVAAINQGLAAATGDVVCLTDDDTEPSPQWLERLAALYEQPGVVGAGGRDRIVGLADDGPARVVGKVTWYGRVIGNHHRGSGGIVQVDHLKGANMSFRREALPPFDPNLFHAASMLNDTDASLGARRHGILLYDPEALVDHYGAERGAGVSRDVNSPEVAEADSHNWTYCMLKHLPAGSKPVFLAYAFLVGQGARIGLLKWLAALPTRPPSATRQFVAATRGKVRGIATYLAAHRRAPSAPEAADER